MLAFVLVVMFHFFSRYGDNYVLPRPPPTIPICYYHHSCHYHDYGNYYQVMFHAMPPLPQRDTLPPLLLLLYDYCYYYSTTTTASTPTTDHCYLRVEVVVAVVSAVAAVVVALAAGVGRSGGKSTSTLHVATVVAV